MTNSISLNNGPFSEYAYESAEAWCNELITSRNEILFDAIAFHEGINRASHELGFPLESLSSFLRSIHLKHVKKNAHIVRSGMQESVKAYLAGTSIIDIARKNNYPPSMIARFIVERVACFPDSSSSSINRKNLTKVMRDPMGVLCRSSIIESSSKDSECTQRKTEINALDGIARLKVESVNGKGKCGVREENRSSLRLAKEVEDALDADPLYGPRFDKQHNAIGVEYEIYLEQALLAMKIPFETEEQLRTRGTARTPDILLSCPVGIQIPKRLNMKNPNQNSIGNNLKDDENFDWKMICWIDSKAMFGDVETHQTLVLKQAETYVHRFGPGLILYWFGHAPVHKLGDGHGDVVVTEWNLPELFMLPTGDYALIGRQKRTNR